MLSYIIGGIALILGIVGLILGLKARNQKIEIIIERERKRIHDATEDEVACYERIIEEKKRVQNECNELEKRRLIEQERANEARSSTDRLLSAEHERARAELKRVKEVEQERITNEFKEKERQLEEQFAFKRKQFTDDFEILLEVYHDEVAAAQSEVNDFQAKRAAINEAIAREKEITEHEAFYSIDVPVNDQEDITVLQSMDLRLHNRDVIPKLIWELFIRRPTTEMIKRVTGGKKIGGIYKITYKKTGESYIGKTVDFATRWQNHVKTAIGLDGAARATLHNRLAKDGLWNYTFEILEEVDKDHLSARESYYIDLYGTKTQLNMKAGDKNGTQ